MEEMMDISKTIYNKWLQMLGNQGNNLFDTTCNDNIHPWMHMRNYQAYLRDHASRSGPSKGELKLRALRQSEGLKKIVGALNTLPRAKGVGIQVPHLEGEEIFGNK